MKPLRLYLVLLVGTVVVAWLVMQLAPIDAAGSFAYQTGAFGTASTLFLESAVRDPGDPFRVYSAGSAQLGLDDSEAADLLLRSYELGDEDLKQRSAYNAGIAYFREADYFAAVRAFRAVLEIDPSDSDARYNYELALRYALPPTPSEQQQRTNPEEGQTDPTITPSPEPGGFDGPTPTPPREEFEPDPTETPVGGTGDFGDDADSTPVPVEGGPLTLEQAIRLLDAAAQDALTISPFYLTATPGGVAGENDW